MAIDPPTGTRAISAAAPFEPFGNGGVRDDGCQSSRRGFAPVVRAHRLNRLVTVAFGRMDVNLSHGAPEAEGGPEPRVPSGGLFPGWWGEDTTMGIADRSWLTIPDESSGVFPFGGGRRDNERRWLLFGMALIDSQTSLDTSPRFWSDGKDHRRCGNSTSRPVFVGRALRRRVPEHRFPYLLQCLWPHRS
jgi:hypothetical protein